MISGYLLLTFWSNKQPVALFTESAETVYTGEEIDFDASASYDPDGSIVAYFWEFGDGTSGTGVTVSHTYVDEGSYDVTLTVTDNEGEVGSTSAIKTVLNAVYSSKTKHDTERWAVITDSKNDFIAVETTDQAIWDSLKNLNLNQTEMWIGGVLEEYDNYWGFRFRSDTIVIAEFTAEGAQSTIQMISEDLNYWINVWSGPAYVFAKVAEIHQ